ncbi:MAG TPA: hypothetical protein VIY08_11360 [Candidatus Nitrosocosmicus sp.]
MKKIDKSQSSIDKNIHKPFDLSANHLDLGNTNVLHTDAPSELNDIYKTSSQDFKEDKEIWTQSKIKEELYKHLASVRINGGEKYEEQARELFYWLADDIPTPYFIINDSDLSAELIEKLNSQADPELDSVIREVLQSIFERINKEYFWNVIYKNNLLQWSLEL